MKITMQLTGYEQLFYDVAAEIGKAKGLFPKSEFVGMAIGEEAGEVQRAALNFMYFLRSGDTHRQDLPAGEEGFSPAPEEVVKRWHMVRKEAVQCAAMCFRLILEGDPMLDIPGEAEMNSYAEEYGLLFTPTGGVQR